MNNNSYITGEIEAFVIREKDMYEQTGSVLTVCRDRVRDMERVYCLLKETTRETNTRVEYKIKDPRLGIGVVSAEGEQLIFHDLELLSRAADIAHNLNVYAETNGNVHMEFIFGVWTERRSFDDVS